MKNLLDELKNSYIDFRKTPVKERGKTQFGKTGNRIHGVLEAVFGSILISSGYTPAIVGGAIFYVIGSFNALTGTIMYFPSKIYEKFSKKDNFWS